MMKSIYNLKLSILSLTANKIRTLFAMIGIAVGVAAVIIMVSIGQGAQRQVINQIESMGTNLLTIKAGKVKKMINRERQYGDVTTLTKQDADFIAKQLPYVESTAPVQDRLSKVKFGNITSMVEIVGSTPSLEQIRNYIVSEGRFFSNDESKAGLRIAVIGNDVYKNLFKDREAIGEIIRINKIPFEVIGRLKPIGSGPEGGNEDNRIIIPLRTALRRVFNVKHLERIYVRVKNKKKMVFAEAEIRTLLRQRHRLEIGQKSDDFTIHNQEKIVEMERESGESFTLLITCIAALSLLVGGIGIMAIMLLSIKERTSEIGLRRAIGARAKDILRQFLSESLLLGLSGGGLGIFLSIAIIWIIGKFSQINTLIPIQTMLISLVFSMMIGLFFGVYPALKASKLNPIDALQND